MSGLQYVDASGPTVDQAIQNGLAELGLGRSDVIIEIIQEGSGSILGNEPEEALVRLTPLRMPVAPQVAPEEVGGEEGEEAEIATETLQHLLDLMAVDDATIHVGRDNPEAPIDESPWILDIRGNDPGILIGRKGETLDSLQYITRLIVSRHIKSRSHVIVDVEGYKARREESLVRLAQRMADQAKRQGRTVSLEPMPANERRIIHMTLRDDNTVETESIGEGKRRKVTIRPLNR